jgi:malonyl-CoA/methylmalonyl-CoA synthetase
MGSSTGSPKQPSAENLRAWARHVGSGEQSALVFEWLTGGTLAQQFAATASNSPHRRALVFPQEGVARTHGELDVAASRLAGWLSKRGFGLGDRAILCGHNSLAFVIAYLAILRAGGVVVLASPQLAAPELTYLVRDSAAAVAFTDGASGATFADAVTMVINLDDPLPEGPAIGPVAVGEDAGAILAYTSGTTGTPKGVLLTHTNLLASIRAAARSWRWSPDDVVVHALPLTHQHGLGAVHAALLTGSCAAVLRSFDPATFAAIALEQRATVFFAVPVMYERLLAGGESLETLHAKRGGTVRLAVSGSAPLSEGLFDRVAKSLGEPVLERYGTTESGLNVSNAYDGPRLSGCIGLPLPGVEVRVVGPGDASMAPGEDGELLVRGPQVCRGYWKNSAATKEAFEVDGWFRTGDIARYDSDSGYLRITGRKKELIITGGYNVYPREVELAIETHPGVAEAAVAGIASEQWGEEVVAWVVAVDAAQLDAAQLVVHTKARLASYKCPKRFAFVERLPRNNLGKLLRNELPLAEFQPTSNPPPPRVHE